MESVGCTPEQQHFPVFMANAVCRVLAWPLLCSVTFGKLFHLSGCGPSQLSSSVRLF